MKNLSWWSRNWEFKLGIAIAAYFLLQYFVLDSLQHHDAELASHLRVIPPAYLDQWQHINPVSPGSKVAYVQYATTYGHINLAVINGIELRKAGTVADVVVVFDQRLRHFNHEQWNRLLTLARDHSITLKPVDTIRADVAEDVWQNSFTKLYAFNMTEYDRVVYFDGDSMLMKGHLDELFSIPEEIEFASPHAYWHNHVLEKYHEKEGLGHEPSRPNVDIPVLADYIRKTTDRAQLLKGTDADWNLLPPLFYDDNKYGNRLDFFGTHIMVITPNTKRFNDLLRYVSTPWWWKFTKPELSHKRNEYDMEVINKYMDQQLRHGADFKMAILPHTVYGVLTGEFLEEYHRRFVVPPQYTPFITKESNEEWDATDALMNVKLIHFSDAPIPKPWETYNDQMPYNTKRTFCMFDYDEAEFNSKYPVFKPRITDDCESVEAWEGIRERFSKQMTNWVV
ncbi:hypothetical protein DIURU_005468 [Diutina rugosa]|uniref:Glucose N-acetyltransferase 1 n=1 Tax=Diutina rugosa TaxID=5481 RepID=A0A642UD12_DIURU|nr:uncharacterized protein DIURU_005468 [Diutina rugosa]KAA8896955.1 hypothetical protein DIURU_005468 [Diutina rugosa]